jgi:uncharacterized protein (DUF433 family)
MASLDWSQCPAVESVPGKRSGAWVFRGTRMPVSTVFENLQDMSVNELVEEFGVTREQVEAVLQFAAHTAEAPRNADASSFRQRDAAHPCSFFDRSPFGHRGPRPRMAGIGKTAIC